MSPARRQKQTIPETLPPDPEQIASLEAIQRRVVWLASRMIDHANHVRPNPEGTKIGGHQASSTSITSILTALYFHWLGRATGWPSSPNPRRPSTPSST